MLLQCLVAVSCCSVLLQWMNRNGMFLNASSLQATHCNNTMLQCVAFSSCCLFHLSIVDYTKSIETWKRQHNETLQQHCNNTMLQYVLRHHVAVCVAVCIHFKYIPFQFSQPHFHRASSPRTLKQHRVAVRLATSRCSVCCNIMKIKHIPN